MRITVRIGIYKSLVELSNVPPSCKEGVADNALVARAQGLSETPPIDIGQPIVKNKSHSVFSCRSQARPDAPRPGKMKTKNMVDKVHPIARLLTLRWPCLRTGRPVRLLPGAVWFSVSLFATSVNAAPPMISAGKTIQAADGVYVIPDGGVPLVPNVGIVVGEESVLVVDTGMGPANAEIVLAEVRKISDLPIRYLVTTHFHPEHNYGAQSFPDETILIYSIAQHEDLQRKGETYRNWFIEMFGDDVRKLLEPVELVPPDVTFLRQARLDLGNLPVQLLYFGHAAHTGGDTVIFLPGKKLAFVGGLAPGGLFPILADEDSSVRGWLATLNLLSELGAEIIVPDHGEIGDTGLIEEVEDYFTAIQSQALELRSQRVELASAQEALSAKFAERYPNWGEPHWIANAVERVYAEAEQMD